jgi:hypothetical protein
VNIPPEAAQDGRARGHATQRQLYEERLEARLREAVQPLLRFGVPLDDAMCVAITIHRVSLLCGYDRAIKKFEKWAASRADINQQNTDGVEDQNRTEARPSEVHE